MSAMFTQHAFERMTDRGVAPSDVADLLKAVEQMAANPREAAQTPDVLRVKQKDGEDAYIVRAGDIRAVVAVDPSKPDQLIVLSVYRADQDKPRIDAAERWPGQSATPT